MSFLKTQLSHTQPSAKYQSCVRYVWNVNLTDSKIVANEHINVVFISKYNKVFKCYANFANILPLR